MGPDLLQALASNVWSVALIIVFFLGSIFVHELGHFMAARWRGLVIERFSIGFGPKIFAWRRNGVEYRISWLPLGGYVALPQLADLRGVEGETEDASRLPPISYADKMIVSVAGAVFNLIFASLLATVLWQVGVPKPAPQTTTLVGNVSETLEMPDGTKLAGPAFVAGIRQGDRIIAVDGSRVDDWLAIQQKIAAGTGRDLQGAPKAEIMIERRNNLVELSVFPQVAGDDRFRMIGIEPAEPLVVAALIPGSPAERAGIQPGDTILRLDGALVLSLAAMQFHLMEHREREVQLTIERAGSNLVVPVQPIIEKDAESGREFARIGIQLSRFLTVKQDPLTQIWDHVTMLGTILKGLVSPASDLGIRHMSGPIGIAHGLHNLAQVSILLVLWFVVLINVNLAILNLLPIPVLDGGHMLFATLAKLRGRDLPGEFVQTVQAVFVVALLGMLLYVSFFDTRRVVRDLTEETPARTAPATPAPAPAPEPAKP